MLILFLFVWFNKHPDLRYGGYVLYSLFFFVPFSVYCSRFTIQRKYSDKFFLITAIIVIIIFNAINFVRIFKSFHSERELYSFKNFPFFNVRYPAYQIILLNDNSKAYLVTEDMCWSTPSPCLATKLNRKTLNNYQFFYIK